MKRSIPPRKYAGALSGVLLAVIFAGFSLLMNAGEMLTPTTEVTVGREAPVSVRLPATYFRLTLLRNEVHFLTTTSSTCPNVIPRGEMISKSDECAGLVQAFESHKRGQSFLHYLGVGAFYFFLALMFAGYLRHETMGRARLLQAQIGLFFLLLLALVVAKAVLLLTGFPAVAVPVFFVPMLVGHYFRRRVAFAVVVVLALSVASLNNNDFSFFLVLMGASLAAALASRGVRRIRTFVKAGVLAGWTGILVLLVAILVRNGTIGVYDDPAEHFDPRYSIWIAAISSGVVSTVLAVFLSPAMSRFFGVVSRSRLIDLQDLNQRLLKRIQEKAPGTWEHSRAMANLAEAAVNAIGGNTALVRVGAYYHDVGKSNAPDYFIENQGNKENPHDELEPVASAARIFKHVVDGTKLLRQEGIPEDVVEFCYSHHGTSVLEYFWYKTMADGNPQDLTEKDFSYPGHKPTTRETGILMLVDAIEAGARTVDTPDKDAFSDLVRRIVFSKLSQGQLDESGLSLGDLRVVVNTLIDTLVNMYHARIKYPWQTGDTTNTGAIKIQGTTEKKENDGGDGTGSSADNGAASAVSIAQAPADAAENNGSTDEAARSDADSGTRQDRPANAAPPAAPKTKARPKPQPEHAIPLSVHPSPKDMEEPAWAMASQSSSDGDAKDAPSPGEDRDPSEPPTAVTEELPLARKPARSDDGPEIEVLEVGHQQQEVDAPPPRSKRALK